MTTDTIRAFIAIELAADLVRKLERLQALLRSEVPAGLVRWVRPEGVHLTLRFLGDIPHSQAEPIATNMIQTCAAFAPFEIEIGGMGCFPNTKRPRVIWVGVKEQTGTLQKLYKGIERAVRPYGFEPEPRGFHPHLTLGRVKGRRQDELQALGEYVERAKARLGTMTADSVSLIQSELLPGGARYTCLDEAPLAAEGQTGESK